MMDVVVDGVSRDHEADLRLARQNLSLRQTPRALVRRATGHLKCSDTPASTWVNSTPADALPPSWGYTVGVTGYRSEGVGTENVYGRDKQWTIVISAYSASPPASGEPPSTGAS
jgi:hypothetical protein